jgi:dGTPase
MESSLPPYAMDESRSRGRAIPEPEHPYRSAFERDRDRIIHCAAFRRLEGKTQVFAPGINENYRTRLTHTIEVAQIGRTIARVLNLNETLTEAICLAHDLGHSPFGHTGQDALNDLMKPWGGFEHNRQALRIVDFLEHPYEAFAGLNLCYETRLGLGRHHSPHDQSEADGFTESVPTLEGQVADIADRIAYNCHDLEDGLLSGLIEEADLQSVGLFAEAQKQIGAGQMTDRVIRRTRTVKTLLDMLARDVIETSKMILQRTKFRNIEEIYAVGKPLIRPDDKIESGMRELEAFLLSRFYHHPSFAETSAGIHEWMNEIFKLFCAAPDKMPRYYQRMTETQGLQRTVCDYIAGMTDRYCLSWLKGSQ